LFEEESAEAVSEPLSQIDQKRKKISTQKKGYEDFAGSTKQKELLKRADLAALKMFEELKDGENPTGDLVLKILLMFGDDWPTQVRPNVSSTGKPVSGMCLGVVNVLGGVGMQVSMISKCFPNMCKLITRWVRGTLPDEDFPFSSLQINYNYRAKRHVDGNNIGPSYIQSIGDHDGGALWTADKCVIEGATIENAQPSKNCVVRGGGGPGLLDCNNRWTLFNGNAEHETQEYFIPKGKTKATRISFIAFSHHSYNKLLPEVCKEVKSLGFTAANINGIDDPFFLRYRIDKKEFGAQENAKFFDNQAERAAKHPPPTSRGVVCIESYGLTMARGGGWFSFRENADDGKDKASVVDLKPNRTGFHVLELKLASSQKKSGTMAGWLMGNAKKSADESDKEEKGHRQILRKVSLHTDNDRFNLYKDTQKECTRFANWVDSLPKGRIVLIAITDTAVAKSRPLPPKLYEALRKIGAPSIEPIGYRHPFAMIGVKGAKEGEAVLAMDKTKVLLRLEAEVYAHDNGTVALRNTKKEKINITEIIMESN